MSELNDCSSLSMMRVVEDIVYKVSGKQNKSHPNDSLKEKDKILSLCRDLKSLIVWDFNFKNFFKDICNEPQISFELLWNLHVLQIMPLETYIFGMKSEGTLQHFEKCFCVFCFQELVEDWNVFYTQTGMLSYLVSKAFPPNNEGDGTEYAQIYLSIAERLTHYIFSLQENEASLSQLKAFLALWTCGSIEMESLSSFCLFSLQKYLKNCLIPETDAFSTQENWKKKSSPFHLFFVIKKFLSAVKVNDLKSLLKSTVFSEDVNWKNFTVIIALLLESSQGNSLLLTDLTTLLIKDGFEKLNPKSFMRVLLIGRQISLCSCSPFSSSYGAWFQSNIGSCIQARNPPSVILFVQVLTDMLPYETNVDCIKIFLERPLTVPHECLPMYSDFMTLLKTRIKDLQPRVNTEQIIERVLNAYKETNKIPPYILEASLLHKHHYLNEFLPALLKSRMIPVKPDLRQRFIELLNESGKIPSSTYLKYKISCQEEQQKLNADYYRMEH